MSIWKTSIYFAVFGAIMGFAMGASIFAPLEPLSTFIEKQHSKTEQQSSTSEAANERPDAELAEYTLWLMIFTGVLALATLGLGAATTGLYFAGERQLAHLKDSSEKQANDMRNAIAESKRSADAANAAIQSDRAWVVPDGYQTARVTNLYIDGVHHATGAIIWFNWKNVGRSPALRAELHINHAILLPNANLPTFPMPPEMLSRNGTVLGPGIGGSTGHVAIDGDTLEKIGRRELTLCIYTVARYSTIFAPNEPRFTQACYVMSYNGEVETPDGSFRPNIGARTEGPQNTAT